MTGGEIAGLLAAGVFAVLVLLLAVPILKLGKVFDELRLAVREISDGTSPLLQEVTTTVSTTNRQLEKVDGITSNVSDASANLTALSSLLAATVGRPLIKVAAFSGGVRAVLSASDPDMSTRDRSPIPWIVAGTSLPDWLGAADRRCRVVAARVDELSDASGPLGALARGVREHLHDDRWFHSNPAFDDVTGELTRRIRAAFPEHRRMRASFIAHILLEMLLDASLDQRGRVTFDAYYAALERVSPAELQRLAAELTNRPSEQLTTGLPFFRQMRFLYGYRDDDALFRRLHGLLARVRQPALPDAFRELLPPARLLVYERAEELLTPAG